MNENKNTDLSVDRISLAAAESLTKAKYRARAAFENISDKSDKKSKYLEVLVSRDHQFAQETKVQNIDFGKRKNELQSAMRKDVSSPDAINDTLNKGMKVEGVMDALNIAEAVVTGGPVLSMLLTEGLKNKILGMVVDNKKQEVAQQNDMPDDMPAFQRDNEMSMELTPRYRQ